MTQIYDENQIQVLEGLEAVRKRPGMYIGDVSSHGLHHLIYEIVDNSIDEALAGECDNIVITLHEDGSVSVQDNGRGIPTAIHHKMKIPTPEVVFTILHAGGKFGGSGYNISGGLHGVGASVVNALSEWLIYEDTYNGETYKGSFKRGKPDERFTYVGKTDKRGLYVRFLPDKEIFEETTFDYSILLNRMREQAFLNPGVRIVLRDERKLEEKDGDEEENSVRETVLHYEGGIVSFVEHLNKLKHCGFLNDEVIYMKAQKEFTTAEIAFQYTDKYDETIMSFANNIITPEGGTHETGFKTALTKVINDYARQKGILKKDDKNLSGEDTREGLTAVISVKLRDAQFEGQTKGKLGNSDIRVFVDNLVSEKLGEYFEEHPAVTKVILEKAITASRAREAARKAREQTRKSVLGGGSALPGKLADCQEKNVDVTELFLVEGDSAGGSAKMGRNSKFQAILPLRGKVLNVEKTRADKVYSNLSLIPIIQALGCGIGTEFDIEKLRYGKIIIMADADVDGSHIRILILTFFFRHMRKLIEDGHVYLAQPPLYKINRKSGKGEELYAFTDEERDVCIEKFGGSDKIRVDRYKGLGEMNPEQLWETTMDPDRRTLLRVTVEDAMACDEMFSLLMGDDVEPRREFIAQNARYVENLDI